MTHLNKFDIDKQVINCKSCELCNLEVNDNLQYYRGYGKLLSKEGDEKNEIMIIGLNPSHRRWQGLLFHYSGFATSNNSKYDTNVGYKLLQIFQHFKVLNKCYITNIVKCSTQDNKVEEKHFKSCYQHLEKEIQYVSPKLIITTGRQIFEFLETKDLKIPIENIKHPNYYFTYNKSKLKEYILEIKSVLEKYKFI